ncbi:MAG TPA: hypothetical protein VK909_17215, partial [Anaerolineales bacterium]|nr:hypothetical protein [Anaerolineales bacterium]
EGKSVHALIKEISLVSQDQRYVFPVEIKYHGLSEKEPGAESVDRITLGFSALIAADTIQPGKYRIGIIFHDPSTGLFYYWDKPARYLIKTPNLLNLE